MYGGVDDPINSKVFLKNKTYGDAPYNTTLTVTYLYGGGVENNVGSNTIRRIQDISLQFNYGLDSETQQTVERSITVTNEQMATGGGQYLNVQQLRQNIKM